MDSNYLGAQCVTVIVDHFMVHGPNEDHICMTFEILEIIYYHLSKNIKAKGF